MKRNARINKRTRGNTAYNFGAPCATLVQFDAGLMVNYVIGDVFNNLIAITSLNFYK